MSAQPTQNSTSITVEVQGDVFNPDQLLDVLLNGSGKFLDHFEKQTGWLDRLTDETLFSGIGAAVTVTTQLREYVSEWIDTGLAADGTERPLLRNLESVSSATQRAISEFQVEYPARTTIFDLGRPSQRLVCDVGCHSLLKGERRLSSDVHTAALAWACSLFVALLMSPWKHRLCICRRCKGYLMLTRAPKDNPYEHGVHCDACASAGSAVANRRENRKERRELLTILAAEIADDLKYGNNPEIIKLRADAIAKRIGAKLIHLSGQHYRGKWIGVKSCTAKWVRTYCFKIAEERELSGIRKGLEKST